MNREIGEKGGNRKKVEGAVYREKEQCGEREKEREREREQELYIDI